MQNVVILGSTGSIGQNTLDVIARHPEQYKVLALTAHHSSALLYQQCLSFKPDVAILGSADLAKDLQQRLVDANLTTTVRYGSAALQEIVSAPEVHTVVAGIVGGAGLLPTLSAIKAGKRVLLANKEALVMAGALMMDAVQESGATLLPVDSEHNALFQCMPPDFKPGTCPHGVERLILTASGGPFRNFSLADLIKVTPEEAVKHPNWVMGPKISVDSASMMNKGLELIEAHYLFQMPIDAIDIILHPQSVIHSLVEYRDGSLLAQLGQPDMRVPIASALSWPARIHSGVSAINLLEMGALTFEKPDVVRFPCLRLATEALKAGGIMPTVLNASNEVAVSAFLKGYCRFTEIPTMIEEVMNQVCNQTVRAIEDILEADRLARDWAQQFVAQRV
ncbi:MAG: 1-deoxy-D-xylulose-5-phosphate reductoisomerase [Gammaproteobacteria bacterium]